MIPYRIKTVLLLPAPMLTCAMQTANANSLALFFLFLFCGDIDTEFSYSHMKKTCSTFTRWTLKNSINWSEFRYEIEFLAKKKHFSLPSFFFFHFVCSKKQTHSKVFDLMVFLCKIEKWISHFIYPTHSVWIECNQRNHRISPSSKPIFLPHHSNNVTLNY